jgi:hypothetical protein
VRTRDDDGDDDGRVRPADNTTKPSKRKRSECSFSTLPHSTQRHEKRHEDTKQARKRAEAESRKAPCRCGVECGSEGGLTAVGAEARRRSTRCGALRREVAWRVGSARGVPSGAASGASGRGVCGQRARALRRA